MVEQILEGVNPTRMDLLDVRKKILLAQKGYKLLEEKRDALVERFFSLIERRDVLRKEVDAEFPKAFEALITAQMLLGEDKVEYLSFLTKQLDEITFGYDNIMGVKIPKIHTAQTIPKHEQRYGFFETNASFDEAQYRFHMLTKKLLQLAEYESNIQSLSLEIEKTKRRVNVLDHVLIPKLTATIKYIEMQLEEREREDFFRRKRIKALLEYKKK
ncbi:MAG: V-type ATP synthase subunit D [Candidatus Thermoplasmatota archaeon]